MVVEGRLGRGCGAGWCCGVWWGGVGCLWQGDAGVRAGAEAVDLADVPRGELVLVVERPGVTLQADLARVASFVGGERLPELDVEPEDGPAVRVLWTRHASGELPDGVGRLQGVAEVRRNVTWALQAPVPLPPRDPYWNQQWGAEAIGVADAWALTGGERATVAVLDSGVDCGHRDLAERCLDGAHYDSLTRRELWRPADPLGHGTHVAGIVAAERDERGVAGMAPLARLLSVRVCSSGGTCSELDLLAGLVWVAGRAEVINMSLGGPASGYSGRVCDELADQREGYGTLPVASVGNNGLRGSRYAALVPASCSAVLGVAAADPPLGRRLADYSSRASVDVTAPGTEVISTLPGGRYGFLSGTSMAAPHVAGAAALLYSAWIEQRGERPAAWEVERLLLDTAERFCGEPVAQNDYLRRSCGHGLVQAGVAVRSILPVGPEATETVGVEVTATGTATGRPSATASRSPTPDPVGTRVAATRTARARETGTATVVGATGTATPVLRGTATGVATGTPEVEVSATACGDPFACARATMTAEVRATATEAALRTEVARRVATATPTLTVGQARRTIEARMYLSGRAWLPVLLRSRPRVVEATEAPPCEPGPEPWGCRQATQRAQRTRVAAETATAAVTPVTPVPTRCPGLVCPGTGRPGMVAR